MNCSPSGPSWQSCLANPAAALREVDAALARTSLADFIRLGWHVLEPTTPLEWNWHVDAIAIHIQAAFEDWIARQADPDHPIRYQNLLINVPPGTGKSRFVSVFAPAWMWLRWPSWRAICLSSNPRVALRDSVYCRDLIESEWFRETFRPAWRLADDQNAKGLYRNTAGGSRQAMGFGSRITGDRADCLLVDDPHDAEEVHSDTIRAAVLDRWDSAIGNRVNDLRSSLRIGVMQRVHEGDWAGHVLAQGDWEHLMIPMEFEPERARTTAIGWRDPRTADGELLFPGRFPPAVIEAEKRRLGSVGFAGQHQQRPAPREGGFFRLSWLPIVPAAPAEVSARVRFWDLAATADGDYTVGIRMARTAAGLFVIEDVVRGRWTPGERDQIILSTARADGTAIPIVVEQEPGSAGVSVVAALVRMLAGFNVRGERATGDKVTRAGPLAAQAEAGNLKIVAGNWCRDLTEEFCLFPNGSHDDQVDAASGAFNRLAAPRIEYGVLI